MTQKFTLRELRQLIKTVIKENEIEINNDAVKKHDAVKDRNYKDIEISKREIVKNVLKDKLYFIKDKRNGKRFLAWAESRIDPGIGYDGKNIDKVELFIIHDRYKAHFYSIPYIRSTGLEKNDIDDLVKGIVPAPLKYIINSVTDFKDNNGKSLFLI